MERLSIRLTDGCLYLTASNDMEVRYFVTTYTIEEGSLWIEKVEGHILPTLLGMPSPSSTFH